MFGVKFTYGVFINRGLFRGDFVMRTSIKTIMLVIFVSMAFGFSNICSKRYQSSFVVVEDETLEFLDEAESGLNSLDGMGRIEIAEELKTSELLLNKFVWQTRDEQFPSSVGEEFSSSAIEYIGGGDIFSLREFCKKLLKLGVGNSKRMTKDFEVRCAEIGLL